MWPFKKKRMFDKNILVEIVQLAPGELEIVSTLTSGNCHFEVIGAGFDHAGVEYRPGVQYDILTSELAALVVNWARHTRDVKLPDGTLQKGRPALVRYWED